MIFFRVIPITIILYRYLMVCHVDFCLSKGEKTIQKFLQNLCITLPILTASISLLYSGNMRGSIVCNGREEAFRFNISNFLDSLRDGGVLFLLPIYHPYRLLAMFFGKKGYYNVKTRLAGLYGL